MNNTKSFRRGVLLSAALFLVVTPLTFSTEFWSPSAFRWLEGLGDFQLKPWIYFAPTILAAFIALAVTPSYRNRSAVLGLLVGCAAFISIAVAIIFVAIFASIPNLRY